MLTTRQKAKHLCVRCHTQLTQDHTFPQNPEVIVLSVSSAYEIKISPTLTSCNSIGVESSLKLTGIVYFNLPLAHYVARIIDKDGRVWYHDGMNTGTQCIYEGSISEFDSARLQNYTANVFACLLIYKKA